MPDQAKPATPAQLAARLLARFTDLPPASARRFVQSLDAAELDQLAALKAAAAVRQFVDRIQAPREAAAARKKATAEPAADVTPGGDRDQATEASAEPPAEESRRRRR